MFGRKKSAVSAPASETPKTQFDEAIDWEVSRVDMLEKSERRAWRIATVSGFLLLATLASFWMLLPLKESVPYVLRVDRTTGHVDIMTALNEHTQSYDEVMDMYWMNRYVLARETYDWYTLNKDYQLVGLLSSANVGAEYAAQFEGAEALDKRFGRNIKSTVAIISVVPNGRGVGTVRFTKTTKRVDQDGPGTVTRWIATISYEYLNPSKMSQSQRLLNPFGFQVVSYRVDPEMVGG